MVTDYPNQQTKVFGFNWRTDSPRDLIDTYHQEVAVRGVPRRLHLVYISHADPENVVTSPLLGAYSLSCLYTFKPDIYTFKPEMNFGFLVDSGLKDYEFVNTDRVIAIIVIGVEQKENEDEH